MAKTTVAVTQSYQQVAAGPVLITIAKTGEGAIFFNETGVDTDAYKVLASKEDQFEQESSVATFVRATGDGWEIIVDGVL